MSLSRSGAVLALDGPSMCLFGCPNLVSAKCSPEACCGAMFLGGSWALPGRPGDKWTRITEELGLLILHQFSSFEALAE